MLKRNADGTTEIDIAGLLKVLWNRIWFIIIAGIIGAAAMYCYARFMITPQYQSSAMFYVNNKGTGAGTTTYQISTTQLSAAQQLVDTYLVILTSRTCLNEVIDRAQLNTTYNSLKGRISAGAVNETEIFKVTVSATSPEQAQLIANTIAEVLPDLMADIVDGSSVSVVDYAVLEPSRTYPSRTKYAAIGLIAGALIVAAFIIFLQLMDDLIHGEEYLTQSYADIPILSVIPDLAQHSGGGYKYGKKGYSYGYDYGYSYGYGTKPEKKTSEKKENKEGSAS